MTDPHVLTDRGNEQFRPLPKHKGIYILPNLITSASLFAGFFGLLAASAGHFETCAYAIIASAILDGLDGKIARLTNSASEFGVQYDSLADAIAFGVTPAFMIYQSQLESFNKLGIAVAFLFMVCSTLRLARFNITSVAISKRFFIGLPTPAAGCALALFVLVKPQLPSFLLHFYTNLSLLISVFIAYLMVSNIRYFAFKELGFITAKPFQTIVGVIILFVLWISEPIFFSFAALFLYIVSGFFYTYFLLPRIAKKRYRDQFYKR